MVENSALHLINKKSSERSGDISILLMEHETASVASLTPILRSFSYNVINVNAASKAVSIIEKQKDIGLVIANIEMPHIDSHSFHTSLIHRDVPLILISSESKTEKISNFLTKRACYSLKKPVSERDITNIWQHVLPKKNQELEKILTATDQEDKINKNINDIEAFREKIRRQTSQSSLLGRQPFKEVFTTFETYQKRRNDADAKWKTKLVCPIEIEDTREEGNQTESNVGRRKIIWTRERRMKFLSAISILGEKDSHPKSILRIMNDPNLTHRQVSSHLQKHKAQIERTNDTLSRDEWRSVDNTFKYPSNEEIPFKVCNPANNFVSGKSLLYSFKKKLLIIIFC
ncbi:unnamed protein product [Thlaspi arvense]|uniref:Response regulatory domain-containing protein n=1 Tax=Thlaspi arvense TaxID=13288 RepID=A0AAU9SM24_THLAR|nr:unnamed protein product [Thlaspi arvense]